MSATMQPHLNERALSTSLGIDKTDKGYLISTQIVSPSSSAGSNSSSGGTASNGYVMVYAEGSTISEALKEIEKKVGKTISLSHCNLIILNRNMLDEGVLPALDYLVSSWQVPDLALIAVADTDALSLQKSVPITGTTSSFQLQQSLIALGRSVQVYSNKLKDFLTDYYSISHASVLPLIKVEEVAKDDSQPQPPQGTVYSNFLYTRSVAVSKNQPHLECDDTDTISVNLMTVTDIKRGNCIIKKDEYIYDFTVEEVQTKWKCKISEGRGKADVAVDATFKLIETSPLRSLNSVSQEDKSLLAALESMLGEYYTNCVLATYEKLKSANIDAYKLNNKFYSSCGQKWLTLTNASAPLENIDFNVSFKTKIILS